MWGIGSGWGAPSIGAGPGGRCVCDGGANESPLVCVECGQVVLSGTTCPSCGNPITGRTVYKPTFDHNSWDHKHHIYAGYM